MEDIHNGRSIDRLGGSKSMMELLYSGEGGGGYGVKRHIFMGPEFGRRDPPSHRARTT